MNGEQGITNISTWTLVSLTPDSRGFYNSQGLNDGQANKAFIRAWRDKAMPNNWSPYWKNASMRRHAEKRN